jgi:hypothetical protein
MKHWSIALFGGMLFAVSLAIAPVASVADPAPAPTPVPVPKPDFSSMNFLMGTWNCSSTVRGSHRTETDVTTIGMDGAWMVTQSTSPPFDQYRTYTINGTTYLSYDPDSKMWVQLLVDSSGQYGLSTSSGWQGNSLTWSGKGLDGTGFSDVFTKVSDGATTDAATITDPQGKVTKTVTGCKKSGA